MTLTLNLLTTTIVAPPSNANKWQMGFNSTFKGLNDKVVNKIFGISTSTKQQLDMLKNHKIILEFALQAFCSPKKNCYKTLLHFTSLCFCTSSTAVQ